MKACRSRREFLARTGQGMVWVSLSSLAACGGGGDAPPATGGGAGGGGSGGGGSPGSGVTGTPVSPTERLAALDAVRSLVASLSAGTPAFDSQALVTALRAMPSFDSVGHSTAVGNVWARFTDGRYIVVPNNLLPAPGIGRAQVSRVDASTRRRALAGGELDMPALLVAQQYRQLDMLRQVPIGSAVDAAHLCLDWVDADTLPALRRMAVGRGFLLPEIQTVMPPDVGIDNGIEGLRDIAGDGVFFLTACAAQVGDDETPRSVICSATPATDANLARYEADLASGLLVHAVAFRGVEGSWQPVPCIAFGPEFVALQRWRFPTESVAILNLSGAPDLSSWVPALYDAGVRNIMAWERPVSWQKLLAFGDDLIQVNLATNNLEGQNRRQDPEPRLRSYGMAETLGLLQDRGVASDGGTGRALSYLQDSHPPLFVNALLPTISYVSLDENRLAIELVGQFGREADGALLHPTLGSPATASMPAQVLVGTSDGGRFGEPRLARAADPLLEAAQPLARPLWPGDLLQTMLREDDLPRGGYVQVVNGGRCSNVVPITHWELPVQAVTNVDELTLTVTVTLRLRADVHAWRLHPDAVPRNGAPLGVITASVHSRFDYVASGSISHYDASSRTRTTVSWSGSGGVGNAVGDFAVNASLTLLWDSRETMLASIAAGSPGAAYDQLTVTEQFDVNGALLRRSESTTRLPVSLAAVGPGLSGPLKFAFDADWNLQAGGFELPPVESHVLPAPPERQSRTRLTWALVRPDFAPRGDFGGT